MPRAAMSVATRHAHFAAAERFERAHSRVLRLVAVERDGGEAGLGEIAADAVGAALGAGEHQHAIHAAIGEQAFEQRPLLLGADEEYPLIDAIDRDLYRSDVDAHRIDKNVLSQFGDRRWHGRREQQRLPLAFAQRDDLPHVVDEAHVEHAVGLVEHEDGDLVEADVALIAKVEQAAGRGDQDVDARLEGLHLVMLADAAEDHGGPQRQTPAVGA